MNNTQPCSFRAVDDANMLAFLTKAIVRKESRTTEDFCTIGGGRIKRLGQLAHSGKSLTRKAKAEKRAQTERRIATLARDEELMIGLETRGSGRRSPKRFVQRAIVVDFRRNGCVDTSMRKTVTVKCKLRAAKH